MIFLGCSAVGYVLDAQYRLRLKELNAWIDSFEQLKGDIDYRLTPLPEACLHVAKHSQCGVGAVFECFGRALAERKVADTEVMWRDAIDKHKHLYHFDKGDYEMLYTFGYLPSYMDKTMQNNQIEGMLKKLRYLETKARTEQEKTSKLYTGMGVLIGACLSILLI